MTVTVGQAVWLYGSDGGRADAKVTNIWPDHTVDVKSVGIYGPSWNSRVKVGGETGIRVVIPESNDLPDADKVEAAFRYTLDFDTPTEDE